MLLQGDCLEEMKQLDDDSIDLIFCDLPYGQTSCAWDCKIDLEAFWKEIMRIKKTNTPLFFTTTTKFGIDLRVDEEFCSRVLEREEDADAETRDDLCLLREVALL